MTAPLGAAAALLGAAAALGGDARGGWMPSTAQAVHIGMAGVFVPPLLCVAVPPTCACVLLIARVHVVVNRGLAS